MHDLGIYHGNINKENIVIHQYEGIKITGFSKSCWIDQIDNELLLNNSYGIKCSNVQELLQYEIEEIETIHISDFVRDLIKTSLIKTNEVKVSNNDKENV
jgi:hypothetical protein